MEAKTLLIAALALVIGLGGGYALAAPEQNEHMMGNGQMVHNNSMGMSGAMDEMTKELEGKTGDEFDETFLSEMIMHHEGAVEMAHAALKNARHEEIKQMANAIISAQTAEIKQMQDWQKVWYGSNFR